jgi:deoxyribonuclease-4
LFKMLIGAHVSTGGGLPNAVERGVERESDAIQIFHQSPRMWRPTAHTPEKIAAFNESFEASRLQATVIHAVYLINTATPDETIREKSLTSLIHALRLGDEIGAAGVVLHAGSRKQDPIDEAIARSGETVLEALAESESCPVLFENTAGTQGPLGRDFDELARLVEAAGAGDRIGVCLDCCHLFASGFEILEPDALTDVIDDFDEQVGLDRLRCLHVNDSAVPFAGNRDKHANVGQGEMGERGIATFLSEPRFESLPALLETPGPDKHGPDLAEVETALRLRESGLYERREAAA